jgi:hypothetical protein
MVMVLVGCSSYTMLHAMRVCACGMTPGFPVEPDMEKVLPDPACVCVCVCICVCVCVCVCVCFCVCVCVCVCVDASG